MPSGKLSLEISFLNFWHDHDIFCQHNKTAKLSVCCCAYHQSAADQPGLPVFNGVGADEHSVPVIRLMEADLQV